MSSDPKPVGGQWHKAARGELSPPKGASEETLVPQLFTASVPDPRTVQIGSGGPDSNKRAQPGAPHCFFQEEQLAPRDWTILGDGPERRNTLTIPLGSSTIRERLDHFCPIVKEDAMAAVAAIESTWTAFRFYCPCECAPESGSCRGFETCKSALFDYLSHYLLAMTRIIRAEKRSCDVFTVREALDLVGRAIEEYAYYAPNMWVESGIMLDDATLELTHCAMDNIVLTLMSGPLGVRPHYLFGDLVINAEAIVDVFNAKTIDPEDLSKTMLWSEVRTKAGANLFLTKAMQPLVPNVPQFQFAVAKDLLDEWFASIEGVQEFFDEQTLSACAISPPPAKAARYGSAFMGGRTDSPHPTRLGEITFDEPPDGFLFHGGLSSPKHSLTLKPSMMLSPPFSPVTANVNDASHFAGGNRLNTPRPPSIASFASQATSGLHNGSQSSHNTYDDYGTTPMSGSLPPSPSPTNAFGEPPTDEGEASAEEMPEDEGIPSGGEPQPVAAHIQVKQAYRVLTNEALGMYHDQGDHDFVMVASGLVAKHPPIRQAFAKVEVEPGTPPPHLRDGVIFAANEPPAKFAIDLERALSEGDARALVGRSVRACLKTYAAIAPKNKEIKIGVQDALEALEMLITTEGTKAFMASGGRGDNPVCAVLWQVALTLMGVITQLGYTYVTSLSKPANETRPTPAMPALTHRSARGAIGILYFHRLFGFAVEDLVERIVAYEDGEGLILTRPIMPIA